MPVQAEKRGVLLGAFDECVILLGANGEVQENLNFSLHRFGAFAILRAFFGRWASGNEGA